MRRLMCCCDKCNTNKCTGFVGYHPQDLAKAQKLGKQKGYDGFYWLYKLCEVCRFGLCK